MGKRSTTQIGKVAGPCVVVLFGASGDLTKRKLVPALYNLVKAKLLPKTFAVMGVAFDDLTRDQFRDQVTSFLNAEDRGTEDFKWFCDRLYYLRGEFGSPATYSTLAHNSQAWTRSTALNRTICSIWPRRQSSLHPLCSN